MVNYNMMGISTLSFALAQSVRDMIVANTSTDIISDKAQFITEKGDIYYPFSKEYSPDGSEDLRFPSFIPGGDGANTSYSNLISFRNFKTKYLSNEITTINYNKTISLPNLLTQLSRDADIYGVVLQVEIAPNVYSNINPMHPMVAFSFAADLQNIPEEGKLHIFTYRDAPAKMAANIDNAQTRREMASYMKDYESFFSIAGDIIKTPIVFKKEASINEQHMDHIHGHPFIENLDNIEIQVTTTEGSTGDITDVKTNIIPLQLTMDGSVTPYYGVACIRTPSDRNKGFSLGPMISGNINQPMERGRGYRTIINGTNPSNVCTGSESNTDPRGWFTLSKVNLSSMHFSDIIDENHVFPMIQISKKMSGDIWEMITNTETDGISSDMELLETADA